jgi:hypothetical protein
MNGCPRCAPLPCYCGRYSELLDAPAPEPDIDQDAEIYRPA